LIAQLAACGSFASGAWAVVNVFPTDISRTLVVTVSSETYSGDAQAGSLPGQAVTVTSLAGTRLVCAFNSGDWRFAGPGSCRDGAGRQHEMVRRDWSRNR
jgi:hypothetical protein